MQEVPLLSSQTRELLTSGTQASVGAVVLPLNETIEALHDSQEETFKQLATARHQSEVLLQKMSKVDVVFAKLPLYTSKLQQMAKNMEILSHNARKLRVAADRIHQETVGKLKPTNAGSGSQPNPEGDPTSTRKGPVQWQL